MALSPRLISSWWWRSGSGRSETQIYFQFFSDELADPLVVFLQQSQTRVVDEGVGKRGRGLFGGWLLLLRTNVLAEVVGGENLVASRALD